jgi:hypothetical protein
MNVFVSTVAYLSFNLISLFLQLSKSRPKLIKFIFQIFHCLLQFFLFVSLPGNHSRVFFSDYIGVSPEGVIGRVKDEDSLLLFLSLLVVVHGLHSFPRMVTETVEVVQQNVRLEFQFVKIQIRLFLFPLIFHLLECNCCSNVFYQDHVTPALVL